MLIEAVVLLFLDKREDYYTELLSTRASRSSTDDVRRMIIDRITALLAKCKASPDSPYLLLPPLDLVSPVCPITSDLVLLINNELMNFMCSRMPAAC